MATFNIGDKVICKYGSVYYYVKILAVNPDETYRVHYRGYNDSWDEDVTRDRLQPNTPENERHLGNLLGHGTKVPKIQKRCAIEVTPLVCDYLKSTGIFSTELAEQNDNALHEPCTICDACMEGQDCGNCSNCTGNNRCQRRICYSQRQPIPSQRPGPFLPRQDTPPRSNTRDEENQRPANVGQSRTRPRRLPGVVGRFVRIDKDKTKYDPKFGYINQCNKDSDQTNRVSIHVQFYELARHSFLDDHADATELFMVYECADLILPISFIKKRAQGTFTTECGCTITEIEVEERAPHWRLLQHDQYNEDMYWYSTGPNCLQKLTGTLTTEPQKTSNCLSCELHQTQGAFNQPKPICNNNLQGFCYKGAELMPGSFVYVNSTILAQTTYHKVRPSCIVKIQKIWKDNEDCVFIKGKRFFRPCDDPSLSHEEMCHLSANLLYISKRVVANISIKDVDGECWVRADDEPWTREGPDRYYYESKTKPFHSPYVNIYDEECENSSNFSDYDTKSEVNEETQKDDTFGKEEQEVIEKNKTKNIQYNIRKNSISPQPSTSKSCNVSSSKFSIPLNVLTSKNSKQKTSRSEECITKNSVTEKMLSGFALFAGCGGLSKGLKTSGIVDFKWAVEENKDAAESYHLNHPDTKVYQMDANLLLRLVRRGAPTLLGNDVPKCDQVDLLCAGTPCQGYSRINFHSESQESEMKRALVLTLLSYTEYYTPKIVIMENVRTFCSHEGGLALKVVLRAFHVLGYQTRIGILNAGNFGVPQSRRRFILFASRGDFALPTLPKPTHASNLGYQDILVGRKKIRLVNYDDEFQPLCAPLRHITVYDAISDLPDVFRNLPTQPKSEPLTDYQKKCRATVQGANMLNNHIVHQHSSLIQARINTLPVGTNVNWTHIPNIPLEFEDNVSSTWREDSAGNLIVCNNHKMCQADGNCKGELLKNATPSTIPNYLIHSRNTNYFSASYGRLEYNRQFDTISTTANPGQKMGRLVHPTYARLITIHEIARAQSFQDCYIFAGKHNAIIRQIGNAVPPLLAEHLGLAIYKATMQ